MTSPADTFPGVFEPPGAGDPGGSAPGGSTPLDPTAQAPCDPFTDPADLYDFPSLGGEPCPVVCEVADCASPRKWEIKEGQGNSGASVVYNGDGLAEFPIRFFAWTSAHFRLWAQWRAAHIAKPPDGSKPKAQDFRHPLTDELGIRAVVVKEETIWKKASPDLFVKDVKFLQYKEPEPAQAKPQGSQASGGATDTPAPETEEDKLIDDLNTQLDQELAA